MVKITETQKKILEVGKKEFLEKGFNGSSLRNIVKEAGFTLGAFYGYYKDKESLFEELVGKIKEELFSAFKNAQDSHFDLVDKEKTKDTKDLSKEYLKYFIDYIYDNFDEFKLLICCSGGTKYDSFINDLVNLDSERTLIYYDTLRKLGKLEGYISKELHHMLTSAYFTAVFEIVVHDMTKKDAIGYIEQLTIFFDNGWNSLIQFK